MLSVPAIYRFFLRQARQLPTQYLRQFWRIKAADDVRAAVATRNSRIRENKVKQLGKDARRLQSANGHKRYAFIRILDIAYGRKGKLKHELLEPFRFDPTLPLPPRIIPNVERSRPPVYTKPLSALLLSAYSRSGQPIKDALHFDHPTSLPERADPNSAAARIFGRLSKRREVNNRWRYWKNESLKVHPPLEVMGAHPGPSLTYRGLTGAFADLERAAAGPPVSRWIRRRHRELLERVPMLTAHSSRNGQVEYFVSLSDHRQSERVEKYLDEADLKWSEVQKNTRKQ
ncbi:hypothetical protein MKEN_00812000 [Mycena kentingensis (nom. inval.)]|nr:hypothetical protein MKEN_00812000 [Mycena kentingensis (nom. inval.)]